MRLLWFHPATHSRILISFYKIGRPIDPMKFSTSGAGILIGFGIIRMLVAHSDQRLSKLTGTHFFLDE
jgi:hypothetical protein